jgi:hypothetical protein
MLKLESKFQSVDVVHSGPELVQICVRLRAESAAVGRGLAQSSPDPGLARRRPEAGVCLRVGGWPVVPVGLLSRLVGRRTNMERLVNAGVGPALRTQLRLGRSGSDLLAGMLMSCERVVRERDEIESVPAIVADLDKRLVGVGFDDRSDRPSRPSA